MGIEEPGLRNEGIVCKRKSITRAGPLMSATRPGNTRVKELKEKVLKQGRGGCYLGLT